MKKHKDKIKLIAKNCIFLLGLVAMLWGLSFWLKTEEKNVYDTVALEKKQAALAKEETDSFDVLFLGNSEAYATFCPLLMYRDYGFSSYVAGVSAQRLCDTYALLKNTFETRTVKNVVLETDILYTSAEASLNTDDKALNYISKILPVFENHSRWKTYLIARMSKLNNELAESEQKGFRYRPAVEPYKGGEYMIKTDKKQDFATGVEKYLGMIKELCEKNNATLNFISAPSAVCWNYAKHNKTEEYAAKNNISFLDMNMMVKELGIDWLTDTKDGGNHLNYAGAAKASGYIGKYLSEKYKLPDHRGEESFASWEEQCKKFFEKAEGTFN